MPPAGPGSLFLVKRPRQGVLRISRACSLWLVSIVNRRNAVLGWLTWEFGKRFARRKAKSALPGVEEGRPHKGLIVSALAAVGAVVFFWRRNRSDDTSTD